MRSLGALGGRFFMVRSESKRSPNDVQTGVVSVKN